MEHVSAIIPVHNRVDYLKPCLQSVFGQTRVPDETIVVDDCSTNSIAEHLDLLDLPRGVRMIRTDRNRRVSGARNWGWRHAGGDLLAFLDSDDLWEPYKTELQVRYLREHPDAAGVYGAMRAFFPDGRTQLWAHDRPSYVTAGSALLDCNISVQTLMIRREALEQIGGFDEDFGILDDQDIAIRLALQGLRIDFLAEPPVALLRRHDQNYSGAPRRYFREDLLINRKHRTLMNEVYGPGSNRVHLARALGRYGTKVRFLGVPSRVASWLLSLSANQSRMPRNNRTVVQ